MRTLCCQVLTQDTRKDQTLHASENDWREGSNEHVAKLSYDKVQIPAGWRLFSPAHR